MALRLLTIGHSTHPLDRFIELLSSHNVQSLADIRRFPGSRRFPQFNREQLGPALSQFGIEYHWLQALGGRRSKGAAGLSVNLGLRNESFRNYADYMATEEFREGIEQLLTTATSKSTAYMCSEGLFWRCHRRLVSDFLLMKGISVEHIMPSGELRSHTLTIGAQIEAGRLTYPAARPGKDLPLFD
jgi:uncharacterized protein (DUF488 family)